ncbi:MULTISPECIES: SRPBCC family protein [Mycobacterium]|uniref:SRPBCC family protein n=1 Tax=Mycobacterium kiyosense TaxID=2871094 RepID=A0A9P3Q5Y3_9MYCO|nr:SRPBCC family protein [Mycobacterium sp. 20KCMC460]BDB43262.1 hypothetical protein IWGMT90018_37080 [Mycobacterium kiyosense]BDE13540.1 hypothetical protein MKCMC460_24000 [Mycobacterium sp. 20KCMC460]GLB85407.1 hypothetical protein SRL2020028_46630 [Mycobacterium kiyosense]GLB88473.1 hypothetical protein SRL2020130_12900 [Mycobacterium kiyosense]GLB98865.1 hypothetical protein SRL2020226_56410 [Mycobacterium kiyosense]
MRVGAALALLYAARRYYLNWGTTKAEAQARMPGDELVADPAVQTTEAISIDVPAAQVWPWLIPEQVNPDWPHLEVGDVIQVTPEGWLGIDGGVKLTVAKIVPEECLVLTAGRTDRTGVWSMHLQPHWEDSVRLLVRVRLALRHPGEVAALELARPAIALGTRRLLRGIKERAERAAMTHEDG